MVSRAIDFLGSTCGLPLCVRLTVAPCDVMAWLADYDHLTEGQLSGSRRARDRFSRNGLQPGGHLRGAGQLTAARSYPVHLRVISAIATLVLISSACGSNHSSSQSNPSPAPAMQIHGDADDPVNLIVTSAIGDLQGYWTDEYPKVYGGSYSPVKGGFYAMKPSSGQLPWCAQSASDISGNAFHCAKADVVVWDVEGLLPDLRKRFGDFVIPVVLAHEWGHAIHARANFQGQTVTKEIQADCFAGAWAAHATKAGPFKPSADDLDRALAGFLFLRDEPGTAKQDPSAHGSGFDRVNSFRNGFDKGTQACKGYNGRRHTRWGDPFQQRGRSGHWRERAIREIVNAVVLLGERPDSSYHLSPGDLDKAIAALLLFQGSGDVQRQGEGSERVDAYRDEVMNGAKTCFTR